MSIEDQITVCNIHEPEEGVWIFVASNIPLREALIDTMVTTIKKGYRGQVCIALSMSRWYMLGKENLTVMHRRFQNYTAAYFRGAFYSQEAFVIGDPQLDDLHKGYVFKLPEEEIIGVVQLDQYY